jgi:hypothetical protein
MEDLLNRFHRGNLPRVPQAAGYGAKTYGYHRLPPGAYDWGTIHPVPGDNPTSTC